MCTQGPIRYGKLNFLDCCKFATIGSEIVEQAKARRQGLASTLTRLAHRAAPLLMPMHESLHFLQGNGAIVVGIHCLEYALVRRLKLLQ